VIWHLINDSDPRRGGAQRIVSVLAKADAGEVICGQLLQRGAPNWIKPRRMLSMIMVLLLFFRRRPKLIIIHSRYFLPLVWVFRAFGSAVAMYTHARYENRFWLLRAFAAHHFVAVSTTVKTRLIACGVDARAITVLSNPHLGDQHFGTTLIDESTVRLGYVGSLQRWKGVAELVSALIDIARCDDRNFCLSVIGDGPLQPWLEEQLRARCPQNLSVRFHGYVEKPFALLREIPILIVPSLEEGFGMVAVEGIFQGKVILYSNVPALSEVCGDDEFSLPFDWRRPGDFDRVLRRGLQLVGPRLKLRSRPRSELVERRYGTDVFLKNYRAWVESIKGAGRQI
jgi:glycosyltransferase involved in cell wall biosynthesis